MGLLKIFIILCFITYDNGVQARMSGEKYIKGICEDCSFYKNNKKENFYGKVF